MDFSPIELSDQIYHLQGIDEEKPVKYSSHDLAVWLHYANVLYGDDISNQSSMKSVITFYFRNGTVTYFAW